MKTVKGTILSSNPVSLSKAAKILSKFAERDNGAPPAFVHYLNRASESFDELVQLHKELRGSGVDRKRNKKKKENGDLKSEEQSYQGTSATIDNGVEGKQKKKEVKKDEVEEFVDIKGFEKKKKKTKNNGEIKNVDVRDESYGVDKKSKKRKSEEIDVDNGEVNQFAEKQSKKRKKVKSERDN